MTLTASLIDPTRSPQVWGPFVRGQKDCYARYGVADAAALPALLPSLLWCIIVRDPSGTIVAGARVQVRSAAHPLPLESTVRHHALTRGLERRSEDGGVAEVGALWSAEHLQGSGIGGRIIAAAVGYAARIRVRHLVSIAHQFNRFTRHVGFEPDMAIGPLPYPSERYRSTVNWCDAATAPTAIPSVRRGIQEMRRFALCADEVPLVPYRIPASRPKPPTLTARRAASMSQIPDKSRPMKHPGRRGQARPLVAGVLCIETDTMPDDAVALLDQQSRLTGKGATAATTVCLRDEVGDLLAVATVGRAQDSPLTEGTNATALTRTAYLGDLAWRPGSEQVATLVLYAAARRARIDGATTLAAHVCDPDRAVTGTLALVPIEGASWTARDGEDPPRALVPAAQRTDVAIDRAYATWQQSSKLEIESRWFVDEVEETIERWLGDIYGRGFFKAVFERSLTREQYVYAASNMHQFVRWTTRLLGLAVGSSHDRTLRDHYLDHLQGEVNHELIIERDLAHLGVDVDYVVSRMPPSPHTRHFMAVQESLIGFHHDPVAFMASPLAAEGIASHLTPEFVTALEETIASWGVDEPRRAMKFFTSHIGTDGGDDGHWENTVQILEQHLRTEPAAAAFLAAMRASMAALTGAYDEYVADLGVLGLAAAGPNASPFGAYAAQA